MAGIGDDSVTKVVAQLRVDYQKAIEDMQKLAKGFSDLGEASEKGTKNVKGSMEAQLKTLERRSAQLQDILRKEKMEESQLHEGAEASRGIAQTLQQRLTLQEKLSKEEVAQVRTLRNRITLLEQQAKLEIAQVNRFRQIEERSLSLAKRFREVGAQSQAEHAEYIQRQGREFYGISRREPLARDDRQYLSSLESKLAELEQHDALRVKPAPTQARTTNIGELRNTLATLEADTVSLEARFGKLGVGPEFAKETQALRQQIVATEELLVKNGFLTQEEGEQVAKLREHLTLVKEIARLEGAENALRKANAPVLKQPQQTSLPPITRGSLASFEAQVAQFQSRLPKMGLGGTLFGMEANSIRQNVTAAQSWLATEGKLTDEQEAQVRLLQEKFKVVKGIATAQAADKAPELARQKQSEHDALQKAKSDGAQFRRDAQAILQAKKEAEAALPNLQAKAAQLQAQLRAKDMTSSPLYSSVTNIRSTLSTLQGVYEQTGTLSKRGVSSVKELEKQLISLATKTKTALADAQVSAAKTAKEINPAEALPSMNATLAKMQSRIKFEGLDGTLKLQAMALREQVQYLMEQLALKGRLTDEEREQLGILQAESRQLQLQVETQSADKRNTLSGELGSMMGRRLWWFASGMMMFGGMQAMQAGLNTVTEMEQSMVQINRVMNDTTFISDEMRKSLSELGTEFGFKFAEVSDIATRWAQAGYNASESLEATRATLIGLNTAELNAESGTQSLIGIMSQWEMGTGDLTLVIDKLNLAADRYAVTTQDLVDGLLRSGAAAKNANISFDDTVGLLVAMRESSGRSGAQVGQALNSMLSFASRDVALETFEKSGISVYADTARTQLRPIIDILRDLANNWNALDDETAEAMAKMAEETGLFSEEMADAVGQQEKWNDLQKRDITQATAATYRRNYMLGLLQHFAQVQQTAITLQDAEGYSLKENAKAMETYTKKVAQMRAALEDSLYLLANETGILSGLKGLVDGVRRGAEAWNDLSAATRNAVLAFTVMSATLIAVNAGLKSMVGLNLYNSIMQVVTLTRTIGVAATATKALTAIFSPTGLLIGGVALLASYWAVMATRAKEAAQAARDASTKANEIERLRDQYMSLAEKTSLTAEEQGTLRDVSQQLVDLMPTLATRFDETGKAILNVGEVASQTSKRMEELRNQTREILGTDAQIGMARLPALQKELAGYEAEYEKVRKAVMQGPEAALRAGASPGMEYATQGFKKVDADKVMAEAEQTLSGLRAKMDGVREQINRYNAAITAWQGSFDKDRPKEDWWEDITKPPTVKTVAPETPPGGGGDGTDSDYVKRLIESETAYVEALQKSREASQNRIEILQRQLTWQTREGASTAELTDADNTRTEVIRLLTEQQDAYATEANAARGAIANLQATQARLNLSTEEGRKANDEYQQAIDNLQRSVNGLSLQWWDTETQLVDLRKENNAVSVTTIQTLDRLSDKYSNGLVTLEEYIRGLESLERQSGLSASAIDKLNSEQAKALKEQWGKQVGDAFEKRFEELNTKIKEEKESLQNNLDSIENVFDGFEKNVASTARGDALSSLGDALSALNGKPKKYSGFPADAGIKNLANDIKGFSPKALGSLSPEEFAKAMKGDLDALRGFSNTAKDYLTEVNGYAKQRLGEIQDEIKKIDDDLKKTLEDLQKQLDALDDADKTDERAKAREEHNKKIAALEAQKRWMLQADAEKYAFEISAIDKQLAEEEKAWSEQSTKWSRDDERERIQDKMDAERKKAEADKKALEDERATLEEQQQLLTDLLNAVVEFVNAQIEARRQEAEDFKKQLTEESKARTTDLENTKTWVEEKRKEIGTLWPGILADMAKHDGEFLAQGKSLVNNIINGINGKKGELQSAINDLNAIMSQYQSQAASVGPMAQAMERAKMLAKGGNLDEAARVLSGAYGMSVEQARQNLESLVPHFANEGVIRGSERGMLAVLGERRQTEFVMGLDSIQPRIDAAVHRSIQGAGSFGIGGGSAGQILAAVERGIKGMKQPPIHLKIEYPDGTIQRVVMDMMDPMSSAVRAGG